MPTLILFIVTALAATGLAQQQPQPGGRRQERPPQRSQQQPTSEELKPEDLCKVEGSVVNGQTGEPIRKAEVQLIRSDVRGDDPDGRMSTTGADGRFTFEGLAPGRYMLRAGKAGFTRQGGAGRASQPAGMMTSLQLSKGQSMRDLNIRMLPHGVITGRVLDEDGDPVARVSVTAYRWAYPNGKKTLQSNEGSSTNDLGEFRIWALTPGTYYISATPYQSFVPGSMRRNQKESFAPTFYPASASAEMATPVKIEAGTQLQNADIQLRRAKLHTVSGVITDAAGQAATNAMVNLAPANGGGQLSMGGRGPRPMSRDGSFSIPGVIAGTYRLVAQTRMGNGQGNSSGSLLVTVSNGDVTGVRLTLQPHAILKGSIKYEGAAPAAATSQIRVSLDSLSGEGFGGGGGNTSAQVAAADNSFQIYNVAAETYRIRISNVPDGYWVKSIQLANQDVRLTGLDFTAAGAGAAGLLEIALAPNAGAIEGSVKNSKDETMSNTTVVLIPKEEWTGLADQVRTTKSGANGEFQFTGVRPGEYAVYAFEDIEQGAWYDPEFRTSIQDLGKTIRVEASNAARADLRSIRP